MNVQDKNRHKRLAYRYTTSAIITIVLFSIVAITGFSLNIIQPLWMRLLFSFIAIALLITSIVCIYAGQYRIERLIMYKRNIQNYKHRVMFMKVIDLIKANRFDEAVQLYNAYSADSEIKIFLYSYIVIARLYSTDPVQRQLGEKRLKELVDKWNPDKIIF